MKIFVDHTTIYRYESPVTLEPHTFRLRPRMTTTQYLLSFDMSIDPTPAGSSECLDQDGNLALHAWFPFQAWELKVNTRFCVNLLRRNPFDFELSGASLPLPLWYSEVLSASLAPYRNDRDLSEDVRQFARGVAAASNSNSLSFLTNLNQRIFQMFTHANRPEGPPWTSDVTLRSRTGSCRDLAVLFCDACRVMGIAARFVSGYECASDGQTNSHMHAWAEVYLPSTGWRGYDPSRGLVVANTHVAVAASYHYDLAAPIAGLYRGDAASKMEALLQVRVERE